MNALKFGRSVARLFAALVLAGVAQAQTTTHTNTTASQTLDTWNTSGSWNNGIPTGVGPWVAIVASNKQVNVVSNSTPSYAGGLTLQTNSTLYMINNGAGILNALGSDDITMGAGSIVRFRGAQTRTVTNGINLVGNARLGVGESTAGTVSLTWNGAITNSYSLALIGNGGSQMRFNNTGNTFNGVSADPVSGNSWDQNWQVYGDQAGSLGSGNVTINTTVSLVINADNAMADTGTLSLNSVKSSGASGKVVMNANDTIGALFIDGVKMPNGAYFTNVASANAVLASGFLSSSGTLTVGSAALYWDIDGGTAGAGGATPSGEWTNAYWNSDSTGGGGGSVGTWTPGQTAYFSAGTDAIGNYVITVDGTNDIGGFAFTKGTATLSLGADGALRLTADAAVYVATNLTSTIAVPLSEDSTPRQLLKGGAGTLSLSGINTYSGDTAIGVGTLVLDGAGQLGGGTYVGKIANSTIFRFNSSAIQTLGGVISGAGSIIKDGAGALTLSGFNTYTGGTTINTGTVQCGATSALGTGSITVNSGGILDMNGYSATNSQVLGSGTVTNTGGACTLTINGNTYSCPAVFSGTGLSLTFIKSGQTFTLTTNSTYGGATRVGGASNPTILKLGVNNALPIGGPVTVDASSSAVLDLNGFNQTVGLLSLGSNNGGSRGYVTNSTGSSTLTLSNGVFCANHNNGGGGIFVTTLDLSGTNQTFAVQDGTAIPDLLVSSVIQNGSLSMTGITATASMGLSGENTYSGPTKVVAGRLELRSLLALQNSPLDTSGAGTVTLSNAVAGAYTLGGLTGSKNLSSVITGNPASLTALVLNPGAGSTNTYSGVIDNRSPSMPIIKTGDGTQILTGTNTYGGTTTVSNGALLVNGLLSNSVNAVIVDGGTLAGTGTISRAVNVNTGGTLKPGDPTGTLTINGDLTIASGATNLFALGASSALVAVTGNLTIDGELAVTDAGSFGLGTYTLFTYSGALTDNGLTVNNPLPGGNSGTIDTNTAGQVNIIVTSGGPLPPVASFTATPTNGTAPLQVVFTDSSINTPTGWAWDFDNNGIVDSTDQNPTNLFSAGTYSVKLVVTNAYGSSTNIQLAYITVNAPATGYDLYATQITNGVTGIQGDGDGDGYANLLEYVTGGDPNNADNIARMNGTRVGGLLALQFTRTSNSVDTTIIVEGSNATTNDANWIGIATNIGGSWGSATNIVETNGPALFNVTAYDTDPSTNRFLRLRVTRP